MKIQATVHKAKETLKRIEQSGEIDAEYEITFKCQLTRREYLKLARQGLVGNEISLDIGFLQQEFDIERLMDLP